MIAFTLERTSTANPEQLFEVLTDHRAYASMTLMRRSTLDREGTPPPNGLGAVRRLTLAGPPLIEEIVEYDPPHRYAYKLIKGMPVRDHIGTVELRPEGSGTRIVYSISSQPTIPGGRLILTPVFKRAVATLMKGAVKRAEASRATGATT